MFCRAKVNGNHTNHAYLRIVENRREGKKTRQRVIAVLDRLKESGALNSRVASLRRFAVGSDGAPDGGQRRTDGSA